MTDLPLSLNYANLFALEKFDSEEFVTYKYRFALMTDSSTTYQPQQQKVTKIEP